MKPSPEAHDPVPQPGFETLCTHFAEGPVAQGGGASPPIHQSSTFIYPDAEAFAQRRTPGSPYYDYTRGGNPTTSILEAKIARLEGGQWAEAFGSGMGAISATINTQARAGAHIVCVAHCYGPTRWYLDHLKRFRVQTTFVNSVDPQDFIAAFQPDTRLVYLESPTSGRFEVIDLEPIVHAACQRGIVTIYDNSWATPYFFRPLDAGFDLVVHSATKFIGGHSDVVAGLVVGRSLELRKQIWREVELCGATLDPFAAWLLIRGLRTLSIRMEYHQRAAVEIARMLESHPAVERVNHPGLESHPGYAIARRQLRGYSSLFSFKPRAQSRAATHAILNRLRLFRQGVSWGGFESLAIGGTFFSDPSNPEWLIRLHAGLESIPDLIADLQQALE